MMLMHVCKKYPQALGGDAVVVSNLREQQEALGHTVSIVTSNCDEISDDKHLYKLGPKDTSANLDTITPKRLLTLVILCFRMFGIIRQEKPAIIHTHSVDMAFFASFAARFYSVPMVHTFHIVTFYDDSQSFFRRKVELWLVKAAGTRSITAPNAHDVKMLQIAGLRQATLLPNGVDLLFWRQTTPPIANQDFVFLSVGRLEAQKGYEHLIEAAALLAIVPPDNFRVVIVGEGSQKPVLQKLIEANHLESTVLLAGRKNRQEIRALLAQADAVVLPSLYETTPLTLLEAWVSSVPVIATSVGILHDAPKDFNAAYIVPPKDPESLMQAMISCMANEAKRTTVAVNGFKEAQQYDWSFVAQTAQKIYGTVL